MAELPKRVGALIIALMFLVTSVGLTIVVIWQAAQQNKQNAGEEPSQTCSRTLVEAQTLPNPEVYKPEGEVTELGKEDLVVGDGQEAKPGDCLIVKYYGTLASDGVKFDGNFDQPTGLQFQLGEGQVIPGWDIGLSGMKVGGTRRLVIPAGLAYGDREREGIPPNSALVFVVKLENIQQ